MIPQKYTLDRAAGMIPRYFNGAKSHPPQCAAMQAYIVPMYHLGHILVWPELFHFSVHIYEEALRGASLRQGLDIHSFVLVVSLRLMCKFRF